MRILSTWAYPIAVSLLLHIVTIIFLTQYAHISSHDRFPPLSIAVELLDTQSASNNIKQSKRYTQTVEPLPKQQAITPDLSVTENADPEIIQAEKKEKQPNNLPAYFPAKLAIQSLSKLTRPPAFIQKIEPAYPVAEQRAGSQANVLAEVTLDEQGRVVEVNIVKSAGIYFDKAVIDALNKSTFTPGFIGIDAVAVRVLVPIRFNLK